MTKAPSLPVLIVLKQCVESVSINLQAPDAPSALRDLASAMEWVNGEIAARASDGNEEGNGE
jgi:hypothetical protein